MNENPYIRFPHLSGGLLTFAARDEVWLARLDEAIGATARAWRLTSDRVPVANPRLSPSGTHVAWSAAREGAVEAYAADLDDGRIQRLTYFGGCDRPASGVRGWLSDSEVLVTTWHGHPEGLRTWPYAVGLDGSCHELPYGPAADVSVSPDGATLVGSPVCDRPETWKRYRGGSVGRIWYSPGPGADYRRIVESIEASLVNPMWVDGRVVFLSDHEGTGALYSALPDGTDLRLHSHPSPFYACNATTDGTRVVYQCAGDAWLLASLESEPVKLGIALSGVDSTSAVYPVSGRDGLGDHALNEDGTLLAAEVRGTAHVLPTDAAGAPVEQRLAVPGVRARLPLLLPGTRTLVCVSDSDGEDGIDILAEAEGKARRLLSGQLGRVLELQASPDAKTLAVSCDDGRLLAVDLETGVATQLARAENDEPTGLAFSPDSSLLAWAEAWLPESEARHVRLARLADRTIVDVTPRRFDDHCPAFTADGRYLVFLSNRTFDPVYDTHMFDLYFPPGIRPYLATLHAETPSPFVPAPKTSDTPADAAEPDLGAIAERIVPFPVRSGYYARLAVAGNAVLWLDMPRIGRLGETLAGADSRPQTSLVSFDLDGGGLRTLLAGVDDYRVSSDGTRLAYRSAGELFVRPTAAPEGEAGRSAGLDRIRVEVDPRAQWRQIYAENRRTMRDNFWREDMGGADWAGLGERYAPLVERIGSTDELYELLSELNGELGTSHIYVFPPNRLPPSDVGLLGADLERDAAGRWRIARILSAETSVAGGRSPLAAPGVGARVGDVIAAVDGKPVTPTGGPAPLLVGKADSAVELTLSRPGAANRRVTVLPLESESTLRYHDLIRRRRALVHDLSGGRLGYVHVPDMIPFGWSELHRDLRVEIAREGLVFDLRENRGGETSELVIQKLARRVSGWNLSRRSVPASYPLYAPRGPIVGLCDEFTSSDGDVGANAFKNYRIGPLVGQRTWGGVVGVDGRYGLVDGGATTQPKYARWFDNCGWELENHGVEPDVPVPYPPHAWAAGRDPQLERAVRLALAALEQDPSAAPPSVPAL